MLKYIVSMDVLFNWLKNYTNISLNYIWEPALLTFTELKSLLSLVLAFLHNHL